MPQYALIADHSPDICPGSNARSRARALEGLSPENMQKAAQDAGLSFVLEPLHLDPSHRTMAVVEAPSIEAVTEFVLATGLFQWNTVETYPVTPIADMMATVNEMPTVFD